MTTPDNSEMNRRIRIIAIAFANQLAQAFAALITDSTKGLDDGLFEKKKPEAQRLFVCKGTPPKKTKAPKKAKKVDMELRKEILDYAKAHGPVFASEKYGVSTGTIAAWKAHVTMGTYKGKRVAKKKTPKRRSKSRSKKAS